MAEKPEVGTLCWTDLTVPDAEQVRNFYAAVVGWEPEACDMGGYSDYTMKVPGSGAAAVGVCHARGTNADLPAQWLIYITVEDLDASIAACEAGDGRIVVAAKKFAGQGRFCVIEDPAGAVAALFEPEA